MENSVRVFQHIDWNGWYMDISHDSDSLDARNKQVSSLVTYGDGWVVFYSEPNYRGMRLIVKGGIRIPRLTQIDKHEGTTTIVFLDFDQTGDWNDVICSVRFFANDPSKDKKEWDTVIQEQGSGTFDGKTFNFDNLG